MIFMTALLRGMVDNMVRTGIRVLPGHVQIHAMAYRDDPSVTHSLSAPSKALLEVLNSAQVAAWTGRVKVPAMISSEQDNRGITLLGIDPGGEWHWVLIMLMS
jgi:ABC-type lipoprotein release transport system permease subunit